MDVAFEHRSLLGAFRDECLHASVLMLPQFNAIIYMPSCGSSG